MQLLIRLKVRILSNCPTFQMVQGDWQVLEVQLDLWDEVEIQTAHHTQMTN